MLKFYTLYYRIYGIRRLPQFLAPALKEVTELSRDAIYHVLNLEGSPDIDASNPIFSKYNKKIITRYPTELLVTKGNPRKRTRPIREATREFHNKNRNFRIDLQDIRVSDPQSLVVYNHSYLNEVYRYPPTRLANYNKWHNSLGTMWLTILQLAKDGDRQHFFTIDVRGEAPTRMQLNNAMGKPDLQLVRMMDTEFKRVVLELWKWLDPDSRGESLFTSSEKDKLENINVIFKTENGLGVVVNMGKLNSYIRHESISSDENQRFAPKQMRNLMSKFFNQLTSIDEPRVQETVDEDEPPRPEVSSLTPDDEIDFTEKTLDEEKLYSSDLTPIDMVERTPISLPLEVDDEEDIYAVGEDEDEELGEWDTKTLFTNLEKELDEIDEISSKLTKKALPREESDELVDGDDEGEDITTSEDTIDPKEVFAEISIDRADDLEIKSLVDEMAEEGGLSASNYKKIITEIESFTQSTDPYGSKANRTVAAKISKEDVKLDAEKITMSTSENVMDKSMNESSLLSYDYDYITKVANKDTLNMVSSLQRSGTVIRKHEVSIDSSILGDVEHHTIELRPIDGVASTLHIKVPKVDPSGVFTANNNKYVMRKQRVDLPIRKINPHAVALTSYFGKTFVRLSQKKAYSSIEYIARSIDQSVLEEDSIISKVDPANVFNNLFEAPYIYNALAARYKTILAGNLTLVFDERERANMVDARQLASLEKDGARLVGYSKAKEPIVVDQDNIFHLYKAGTKAPIGTIYRVLGIDEIKAPVDFSEVSLFGKSVPVGLALGFYLGFRRLLALLNVPYRTVLARRSRDLADDEYALIFNDMSYIFSRKDVVASYVLGGFLEYRNSIKNFRSTDFDKKDVYLNVLASRGLGVIYIRELRLINEMFVDPITKEILEEMGEPTTFIRLLLRATELLQTYHHPDPQDMRYMRIRGYERIPGAIYTEMTKSIRSYRHRNISGKSKIELSPYAVWQRIMKDSANKIVEDTNPIQNLKEQEIVTYVGEGGRSKDAIVKKTREYHTTDIGVISEATVDSSDVGVNAYLSSDPSFTSIRGLVDVTKDTSATSRFSTSANLVVGADRDDPKRINFISIQNGHVIACEGYHQPQVRTGYEYVMASRVGPMFCYTAKEDGKVVSVTDSGVVVEYKSGRQEGVELGIVHGSAEGTIYPHEIVAMVKPNQRLKKGDAISYNTGFFERDILDPSRLVYKHSKSIRVALIESPQTFEDSCAISTKLSGSMSSKFIKIRSFVLDFDQAVAEVVRAGKSVEPNDILLVIQDSISTGVGGFDDDSLDTLRKLSRQAPRARHLGVVDRVEVFYNGDKRDMHPSLKTLADASDRRLSAIAKSTGRASVTGKVTEDYRIEGKPLTMDQIEIKVYITTNEDSGVGDKLIFAAQGKSTVGEVMSYKMTTQEGQEIDAVFGHRSFMNRVVNSAFIIGTATTLLDVIAAKSYELYKS